MLKKWFQSKEDTIPKTLNKRNTPYPGLMARLSEEGAILQLDGSLTSRIPHEYRHLNDLLPSQGLDMHPHEWEGETFQTCIRDHDNRPIYLIGSIHKECDIWKLSLLDITEQQEEKLIREKKEKLINIVIKCSREISASSRLSLMESIANAISSMVQAFHCTQVSLLVQKDNGFWHHLIPPSKNEKLNTHSHLYDISTQINNLNDDIIILSDFISASKGITFIIPYYQGNRKSVCLQVTEYSSSPDIAKEWKNIAQILLSAVATRLSETKLYSEKSRLFHIAAQQGTYWWEYNHGTAHFRLSAEMEKILELPARYDKNDFFSKVFHAEREEFKDRFNETINRRVSFRQKIRLQTAGNKILWYDFCFDNESSLCLEPGFIGGSLSNVNTHFLHEQNASKAHERITSLVANAPAVIYIQEYNDGSLNNIFLSDSISNVLGLSAEKIKEDTLLNYIHPEDKETFHTRTKTLLKKGIASSQYRLLRADGSYRWVLDEAKLLRDSWGKPQEVIGLYIDVTDAVIANEELNISKERYRILIEDSPAIICRYSYELDLTFANKQLLSYLKIENLKGNSINLKPFLSEDQISNFNKRLKSLTPSKPIVNAEICFQFPNQEPLWVVWAERGIFDNSGILQEVQAVGRDNTEVHNARLEMYQSAKMAIVGEMATTMAHEINQPLCVMKMSLKNLSRKLNSSDCDNEYIIKKLNRIEEQITRSTKIVDQLKLFGRRSALEDTFFEPQNAIAGALSLTRPTLSKCNIVLSVSTSPAPLIKGHQDQLEQVLINLIINAKDALLEAYANSHELKPQIKLDLSHHDNTLLITVEDNGGGIPDYYLEKIFESFFTTKPHGKGNGLGLAISRRIIKRMNGELTAENTANGARFTIYLPC
ncbi:PAS domain-containing sensor histidine kinase [Oceanimonas doudoroffii]|uniref:histidine kinase n=1 Tax=Oceanimonas doudoroffii TaxID=84158 RepID=A0A233RBV6_9GAMM|nr:ATP-binding protein [Oceanimonas doudoroffii]OXY80877.1 hypothetical protein B6S08_15750 [Oceanimonas doudoroffii]